MHSDLLHRSGRNTGTSDRIAYQCGYTDAATRFLDAGLASDLHLPLFRGAA